MPALKIIIGPDKSVITTPCTNWIERLVHPKEHKKSTLKKQQTNKLTNKTKKNKIRNQITQNPPPLVNI